MRRTTLPVITRGLSYLPCFRAVRYGRRDGGGGPDRRLGPVTEVKPRDDPRGRMSPRRKDSTPGRLPTTEGVVFGRVEPVVPETGQTVDGPRHTPKVSKRTSGTPDTDPYYSCRSDWCTVTHDPARRVRPRPPIVDRDLERTAVLRPQRTLRVPVRCRPLYDPGAEGLVPRRPTKDFLGRFGGKDDKTE